VIRALVVLAGLVAAAPTLAQERPWVPLPDPVSATCLGGLCQPEGLGGFFVVLNQNDAYSLSLAAIGQKQEVVVVQFGDSHTAGGHITGALLSRLRARFPDVSISLDQRGVVGATLADLDDAAWPADAPPAALVIVAYGTNEGFDDLLSPPAYERLFRARIRHLQRTQSGAILVLGAPEAMRGEGGGTCAGDTEGRWKAPAMLAVVRDVQQRVSEELGVAFWDWRGRMGGDCSAHALTLGDEPLMRSDHVHFTGAGGDWIGSLLADDIIAAYDRLGKSW
jgi:lysophospholipase L1-like esterase